MTELYALSAPLDQAPIFARDFCDVFGFVEQSPPANRPFHFASFWRATDDARIEGYLGSNTSYYVSTLSWAALLGQPEPAPRRLPEYQQVYGSRFGYGPAISAGQRGWRTDEIPEIVTLARRTGGGRLAVVPCGVCGLCHSYRTANRDEWHSGRAALCKTSFRPIFVLPIVDGKTGAAYRRRLAAVERQRQKVNR